MIFHRIYLGETAKQIGISEGSYKDRRETIDLFKWEVDFDDFVTEFPPWLKKHQEEMFGSDPVEETVWSTSRKSRGFGDTVAKLTSKVGVKPCGGCKQRQKTLNRIFPYNRSMT